MSTPELKKPAHTLGDWHIGRVATEHGMEVAIYGPRGEHIATLPDMLPPEEILANARLIIAAPELLGCLDEICSHTVSTTRGSFDITPSYIRAARAAIAKATGDTP